MSGNKAGKTPPGEVVGAWANGFGLWRAEVRFTGELDSRISRVLHRFARPRILDELRQREGANFDATRVRTRVRPGVRVGADGFRFVIIEEW